MTFFCVKIRPIVSYTDEGVVDGESPMMCVRGAYFVFQLQAVGIFTPYRDVFRVSLISLCLKTFRGVARSKPILGGLIYFYHLEIANKRNGVYLRLSN